MSIEVTTAQECDPRMPERARSRVAPSVATLPAAAATVLLAAIFLYSGAHTLYYGTWSSAFVPLASGAALLMVVFLYLRGFPRTLLRIGARGFRHAEGMSCRFGIS